MKLSSSNELRYNLFPCGSWMFHRGMEIPNHRVQRNGFHGLPDSILHFLIGPLQNGPPHFYAGAGQ